ncbi:MAG TPA: hypothetical protein VFF39_04530 [Verrucomicrobiae bacterium]|nr:hypothetical protein [Verrucomicrobiae bacterium]
MSLKKRLGTAFILSFTIFSFTIFSFATLGLFARGLSALAQASHGISPRPDAGAYSAHGAQDGVQMGASLLTHKELKKVFATDVNKCCLVVEVALFPPKNNFVRLSLDDFMLRETGLEVGARPSSAEVLAARLEVQPVQPDREHTPGVDSSADVGYERTGGPNQDPTQRTNRGGIYQRERVGVGIPMGGKPRGPEAAAAAGNRRAIEAELREKGLPEVDSWEPVAGYLYFSIPKKSKNGYELVYMMGDKKIVLPLK